MSKMYLILCILCISVLAGHAADTLMLADFNTGNKPNNVDGDFGAWGRDPEDFSQTCWEEFDTNNTRLGEGYCMMLEYDVDSKNAAYNGFWMEMTDVDASDYDNLVLWIKSDEVKGGTSRLKIEMKTEGERGAQYIDGISSEWTRFEIPLFDFLISDYSVLVEMVFVFEDHTARPKEGFIYVDDIALSKNPEAPPPEPEPEEEAAKAAGEAEVE